jgi:hypothetical protein
LTGFLSLSLDLRVLFLKWRRNNQSEPVTLQAYIK